MIKEPKEITYESEVMHQLMRMVSRVAPSNASTLILGETGTGKEMVATKIHDLSNRRHKPFVAINCGSLRETLLESELFGHEKGAFTGAYTRKIGLAEVANGGTLFLDEIGELSPGIQAKILRFLQEGEFYRVGGKDPIKVDVRFIAATNRELDKEVLRGNFREDLFYRINTIMLQVPALRRRMEDLDILLNSFLTTKKISSEARTYMKKYNWPGNIRELQNVCERLEITAMDQIVTLSDLPQNIREYQEGPEEVQYDPDLTLHELEKRHILKALDFYKGNKTQAAASLGITIKTLYNKLHEFGEFERFTIKGTRE